MRTKGIDVFSDGVLFVFLWEGIKIVFNCMFLIFLVGLISGGLGEGFLVSFLSFVFFSFLEKGER